MKYSVSSKLNYEMFRNVKRLMVADGSKWYTARVTQIPTFSEKVHMLTIQNIQGNVSQWLDTVVNEHPDLL